MSSVVIIGIAGGSGSGKTTFSRLIQSHLTDSHCGWLAQDRYYKSHPKELLGQVNYDHPESIEFSLLAEHLASLKRGEDLFVPQYDFASHSRLKDSVHFPWRPVVVVDGILILSQPQIRDLLDYSFYIDTHEDIRFQRRLDRDVRERGRTPEGVREQFFNQVKPMHDLFVEPSRAHADRIVSGALNFTPIIEELVFGLKKTPAQPSLLAL